MTFLPSALKILLALIALLAASAVLTSCTASSRTKAWEERWPPEGEFIDVAGQPVHYVRMGDSGPQIVLIHGASGNTRDMEIGLGKGLADRYQVLIFDRPGLGYTPTLAEGTDSGTPAEQADVLRQAAVALGFEKPIVLGHSYGGAVALAWVTYHPENAAALVDLAGAIYPWGGDVSTLYDAINTSVGSALLPPMINAFAPTSVMESAVEEVFEPEAAPDGYFDDIGVPLIARKNSMRANALQVAHLDAALQVQSQRYGEITMPVEIMHGTEDTTVYLKIHSQALADLLPQANFTPIEGAGHMIHHTHIPEVVAVIDRAAKDAGLN